MAASVQRTLPGLIRSGVLDGELGALLWLLIEDGVPLIVTGDLDPEPRAAVAAALLDVAPDRPWVILDADHDPPDAETLGATLRGGVTPAISTRSDSLRDLLERLTRPPRGLPDDAVRRLGAVLVLAADPPGTTPRVHAAHYLRPTERDAQGHLQRRPPAVLATIDPDTGALEHFAWGITPELADRVDRSQADFERRQASRADVLTRLASEPDATLAVLRHQLADALAAEPPREPAPEHAPARASGTQSRLTDPHVH